ncbi:RING finger domain-containing protein [Myxozyma melibiosi]|uniref:RING finger domain-containing protein n=1 Tax=Myxozyma melibiosi TaxID=54550 RepID=A0ABR1F1N2_9ASCO
MTRHSKNNTASPFFTAYERSLLTQYGKQRKRLTADSFRAFDACHLCLMSARDPVACPTKGHIFCRECIMENLLAQRAEITVKNEEIAAKHAEMLRAQREKEQDEREKEVRKFESLQSGIKPSSSTDEPGAKRKLDPGDHERSESTTAIILALPPPTSSSSKKQKLQDSSTDEPPPKLVPLCPASDPEDTHPLSLKALTPVNFETLKDSATQDSKTRVCPSCSKAFGTVLEAYLAKPCGHLICKTCFEKVMKPMHPGEQLLCYVCQADLSPSPSSSSSSSKKNKKNKSAERGLIFLPREGTGFSAGGKAVVEKAGVAFQG